MPSKIPFRFPKKITLSSDSSLKPAVLTFAGWDPSAGAGLALDLKVIFSLGGHGLGVVNSVTYQNTNKVSGQQVLPSEAVKKQLDLILEEFSIQAIKVGLIGSIENYRILMDYYKKITPCPPLVIDPIWKSSSGFLFFKPEKYAAELLENEKITLLTPNIPEAEYFCKLLGESLEIKSTQEVIKAAEIIKKNKQGPQAVLIKGGHLPQKNKNSLARITDVLYNGQEFFTIERDLRIFGSFHGSGCFLSTAIAVYLAQGYELKFAIEKASDYLLSVMEL